MKVSFVVVFETKISCVLNYFIINNKVWFFSLDGKFLSVYFRIFSPLKHLISDLSLISQWTGMV